MTKDDIKQTGRNGYGQPGQLDVAPSPAHLPLVRGMKGLMVMAFVCVIPEARGKAPMLFWKVTLSYEQVSLYCRRGQGIASFPIQEGWESFLLEELG